VGNVTSRLWDDDEHLLEELAEALRSAGPVSERMRAGSEAAYTWRRVDEELALASIAYDSLLDTELLVRSAAGEAHRIVLFEAGSVSVEVERNGASLVGQVVPPERGEILLEGAGGRAVRVPIDELGCFCIDDLPPELVRFRCETPTAHLVTDWIRL
jgi:hypothetical protein